MHDTLNRLMDRCARVLLNRLSEHGRIGFVVLGLEHGAHDDEPVRFASLADSLVEEARFDDLGRFIDSERLQDLKLQMIADDIGVYCLAIELPRSCLVDDTVEALVFCHLRARGEEPVNLTLGIRRDGDNLVASALPPDAFRQAPLLSTHMFGLIEEERPSASRRIAARLALVEKNAHRA